MLTIEIINQTIRDLAASSIYDDAKHNQKLSAQIEELKPVKLYLQTNPKEEFVKKELTRLEELREKVIAQYCDQTGARPFHPSTKKAAYKNAVVPNIEQQIKTLKYILQQ